MAQYHYDFILAGIDEWEAEAILFQIKERLADVGGRWVAGDLEEVPEFIQTIQDKEIENAKT